MPIIKTSREDIVKKSIQLFKIHGYYKTTMASVGEACGLIKGSVYHHFKSKEDLALGCLKYIHEYFNSEILSVAYDKSLPANTRLSSLNAKVGEYFLNSEGGCLLGNLALEISNDIPLLKREIIEYFKSWQDALVHILLFAMNEQQAEEKARHIVSSTQGGVMLMRLDGNKEAFKAQIEALNHLLP